MKAEENLMWLKKRRVWKIDVVIDQSITQNPRVLLFYFRISSYAFWELRAFILIKKTGQPVHFEVPFYLKVP